MTLSDTPLRMLVKSYANGLLTRRQYLEIRKRLLHTLSNQGAVSHEELEKMMNLDAAQGEPRVFKKYSGSDWLIILLGLLAAGAMGYILYS